MASMGKFDCKGLKDLQKELDKLQKEMDLFVESCAKELAARLLAKVIKRTPVGDYDRYWTDTDGTRLVDKEGKEIVLHKSKKRGGTLRRGWTTQKAGSGAEGLRSRSAKAYVDSLKINHFGNVYVVEIFNPVEYASYVEYGHRTVNHRGWVPGRFMLSISEKELREIAPRVLENKIKKFLGGIMK